MWQWILLVVAAIFYLIMVRDIRKKMQGPKKSPFDLKVMQVVMECKRCKSFRTRQFKRGDYILKKTEKKCKCGWKMIITKIYHKKPKSKKQLRWEKEMEKWQGYA